MDKERMRKIHVISSPYGKLDVLIGSGNPSTQTLPFSRTILSEPSLQLTRSSKHLSKPASVTPFGWDYKLGSEDGFEDEEEEQYFSKSNIAHGKSLKSIPSVIPIPNCMPVSTSNFSKFARVHCGKAHRSIKAKVSSGILCGGYTNASQLSSSKLNEMFNQYYGIKDYPEPIVPALKSNDKWKKKTVTPKKEEHAFKRIWERQHFEVKGKSRGATGDLLNWKKWPPRVPPFPFGVKIPVDFTEQIEYNLTRGEITEVGLGIEAQPKALITRKEFESLRGILNLQKATSCLVTPTSVVFSQSKEKEIYTATLKIHNTGRYSRRICIVRPQSKYFDVIWGAELDQKATLPPGLSVKVLITFKPLFNEALNDMMTILISDDGGIVVPLLAVPKQGPALEMEEFDCGTTNIGVEKLSRFNIRNFGNGARFWILTEEEFTEEKFAERRYMQCKSSLEPLQIDETKEARKHSKKQSSLNQGIEEELKEIHQKVNMGKDKDTIDSDPRRNDLDRLITDSFRLHPACFSLEKGQEISLKVRFKPNKTTFYFEKIVILCDNGEVRWVALKGSGIDIKTSKVIRLEGDWRGPPSDLPSDVSAELSLDLGDLLAGQIGKQKFSILNLTQIPLTFFWSIRRIQSPRGPKDSDFKHDALQSYPELSLNSTGKTGTGADEKICGTKTIDGAGKGDSENDHTNTDKRVHDDEFIFPISITPNHGVLNPKDFTDIEVSVNCPTELGYHGCVISVFLEQNTDGAAGVHSFIEEMGGIDLDTLSLPPAPPLILIETIKEPDDISMEQPETQKEEAEPKKAETQDIYAKLLKASKTVKNIRLRLPKAEKCPDPEKHVDDKVEKRSRKYKHLKPTQEIELWLRTIPMNCYFKPEFLLVSGAAQSPTLTRTIEFFNESNHPIAIHFDDNQNDICSISTEQTLCIVEPNQSCPIKLYIVLRENGTFLGDLTGKLILPFTEVECSIPFQVNATGIYIDIMTPIINFGLVAHKAEKVKTVSIRNDGQQRASWHAKISKDILLDQNDNELSIPEHHVKVYNLVRIWPDWGVLNPGETCGFQVYLFAEVTGSLTSAIEITIEENSDCTLCVPILAEIQYPSLFLEKSSFPIEIYPNTLYCLQPIRLINPGGFVISFKWGPPMGTISKVTQIEITPDSGIVMPRTCCTCEMNMIVERETIVDNLFIPCFVDGMREPLILEISGKVFPQGRARDEQDGQEEQRAESPKSTQLQMLIGGGDTNVQ